MTGRASRPTEAAARAPAASPARGGSLPDPREFESLIEDLLAAQNEVIVAARHRRTAIAQADARAMQACLAREQAAAGQLERLNWRRRQLVGTPGGQQEAGTLTALAEQYPEPVRSRLTRLAASLKERIAEARREHQAVALATRAMLAHVEGVFAQVGRVLSHTGTYARSGRFHVGQPVMSGLDLTR